MPGLGGEVLLSGDGNTIIYETYHPAVPSCEFYGLPFDCTTRTIVNRTTGHHRDVTYTLGETEAISHDGRYVITSDGQGLDSTNRLVWSDFWLYDRTLDVWEPIGTSFLGATIAIRGDGGATVTLAAERYNRKILLYDRALRRTVDLLNGSMTNVEYPAFSADGSRVAFAARDSITNIQNIFVLSVDDDRDGMADPWETVFGFNPSDAADATADADGDGRTNLAEYLADTHPTGKLTQYLAEGSSNAAFRTHVAVLNPHATPVAITMKMQRGPGMEVLSLVRRVPAHTRITIYPAEELDQPLNSDYSTVVESDAPVVVDRTMRVLGTTGHGAAAETATQPSMTWYFAEGATGGPFSLFYLLQNPGDVTAHVTVS